MPELDPAAIAIGTVIAFVIGSTYYSVLGERLAELRGASGPPAQPVPRQIGTEVVRCLILATVVSALVGLTTVDALAGGAGLGVLLWVGLPLVLWIGAINWEGTDPRFAALHAGDWLIKLVVLGALGGALA